MLWWESHGCGWTIFLQLSWKEQNTIVLTCTEGSLKRFRCLSPGSPLSRSKKQKWCNISRIIYLGISSKCSKSQETRNFPGNFIQHKHCWLWFKRAEKGPSKRLLDSQCYRKLIQPLICKCMVHCKRGRMTPVLKLKMKGQNIEPQMFILIPVKLMLFAHIEK
jgi:hypothetical protein